MGLKAEGGKSRGMLRAEVKISALGACECSAPLAEQAGFINWAAVLGLIRQWGIN